MAVIQIVFKAAMHYMTPQALYIALHCSTLLYITRRCRCFTLQDAAGALNYTPPQALHITRRRRRFTLNRLQLLVHNKGVDIVSGTLEGLGNYADSGKSMLFPKPHSTCIC